MLKTIKILWDMTSLKRVQVLSKRFQHLQEKIYSADWRDCAAKERGWWLSCGWQWWSDVVDEDVMWLKKWCCWWRCHLVAHSLGSAKDNRSVEMMAPMTYDSESHTKSWITSTIQTRSVEMMAPMTYDSDTLSCGLLASYKPTLLGVTRGLPMTLC